MMANRARGEVMVEIDGQSIRLCLTMRALAILSRLPPGPLDRKCFEILLDVLSDGEASLANKVLDPVVLAAAIRTCLEDLT